MGGIRSAVGVGTAVGTGLSSSELTGACLGGGAGAGTCSSSDGTSVGVGSIRSAVGVGTAVATGVSVSELNERAALLWRFVPFPDFVGRSSSGIAVAASGIWKCSVAASGAASVSGTRHDDAALAQVSGRSGCETEGVLVLERFASGVLGTRDTPNSLSLLRLLLESGSALQQLLESRRWQASATVESVGAL